MAHPEAGVRVQKLELSPQAARILAERNILRDLDRLGQPHLLVKVPALEQALQADVGIEVTRGDDGSVGVTVLLYDIPTEPVSYELQFRPDCGEDFRYLKGFLDAAQFRLYPCWRQAGQWLVGPCQTCKIPKDVLLRLRHYVKEWPNWQGASQPEEPEIEPAGSASSKSRSMDPRDTVIRKLKEQAQGLRELLQERDKRIIELEDELHELKSRGRPYKLSGEKKPWWKPFS